jgi:hypothetical protein
LLAKLHDDRRSPDRRQRGVSGGLGVLQLGQGAKAVYEELKKRFTGNKRKRGEPETETYPKTIRNNRNLHSEQKSPKSELRARTSEQKAPMVLFQIEPILF